jgi:hypothetical protein
MQKEECRMKKPGFMKAKHLLHSAGLALVLTFSLQPSALFAQGSLTPPGAPGPTMKTLVQIEPRTPIASVPVTITAPGSYYLTTNVSVSTGDAITIATNGVTLDLKGFTISSTAPSATGHGIKVNGNLRDITIFNGHIRGGVTNNGSGVYSGSGFAYGIFSPTVMANTLVSRVSVSGCLNYGIFLGNGESTVVEFCTARTVGGIGIYASAVKSCSAFDCGNYAIVGDQVSDCSARSGGSGTGVYGQTVQNCYGYSSSGIGVVAYNALNCFCESGGNSYGLYAYCAAENCYGAAAGSSGTGLYVPGGIAHNCYGNAGGSGYGVYAQTALNCVGHSQSGNGVHAFRAASTCYGSSYSGTAVYAPDAQNCYGESSTGTGLAATNALNCIGVSYGSGYGLYAHTAHGCLGQSSSGTGLRAESAASSCRGYTSSGSYGLFASLAQNCYCYNGGSGYGLYTGAAENCWGYSATYHAIYGNTLFNCMGTSSGSGVGIYANDIAIGCRGSSSSGIGVLAYIANSCRVASGTTNITHKYNMP